MLPLFLLKNKKKRKCNASPDVSDGEPSPHGHGEHAGIDDMDGITQVHIHVTIFKNIIYLFNVIHLLYFIIAFSIIET